MALLSPCPYITRYADDAVKKLHKIVRPVYSTN